MNNGELTPSDLAALNAGYWANLNKIRLQSGIFSFKNHEYQVEPMQGDWKRVCYMKATGGGISEIEVLKSLHGLIHGRYSQGVLYMFPTTDDVGEFSKSRFNPLIMDNGKTIGQFVKQGGKGTDTTSLKKVGKAYLYLRGARLTQSLGAGEDKESGKLRSIQVDRVVFDEEDLMDDAVVVKAQGRMGHSSVKEEVHISNPTLPGAGIDAVFQLSDQRHYFNTCEHCGHKTCAALNFPNCVKLRDDLTGYIACMKCGREIRNRTIGEWVPAIRENTEYMRGYHWSQLNSIWNDPADILADFENPPHGNLADIYRLRLGYPYAAEEDKLKPYLISECCGSDCMANGSDGPCAMGVDVGKVKYVIIGIRTGEDSYGLLKMIRVSKWSDIHDLAKRFNVRSAVIDIRPYEDEARNFQRAEPYSIFLCEYQDTTVIGPGFNPNTGIVKVNRTEICDATHRIIIEKKIIIPRKSDETDEFIEQCCNIAKVLETNKRTNTSIYRYRPCGKGGDHYRHALNYFYLAASRSRIARYKSIDKRPVFADSEYRRI